MGRNARKFTRATVHEFLDWQGLPSAQYHIIHENRPIVRHIIVKFQYSGGKIKLKEGREVNINYESEGT